MTETKEIIKTLESFAPPEFAEPWDNSGWQINLNNEKSEKVLACLSVTQDVLDLAVNLGCDLIISHHPLIFSPLKKIIDPIIIKAVQNNIQIYSAHTNFDKAKGGTSDILAQRLGLENVYSINEFVRCGELPFELPLEKFIAAAKNSLVLGTTKLINKSSKDTVKTAAICAGSGSDFINDVCGVDVYITSDVKYHAALEVKDMVLLDIGHFQSEKFFAEKIKEIFEKENTEVIVANEKPAWIYV